MKLFDYLIVGILTTASVLAFIFAPSGQRSQETVQPAVIMEVLDPSLEGYAPLWKAEIGRRFPNAVGILLHGGDFVEGQWIVGGHISPRHVSPVREIVEHYQKLYPTRTIVLLACNTGHLSLGIPGVYYAKSSVWCVPDRAIPIADGFDYKATVDGGEVTRASIDPDVVGNIYEFVRD